MAEKLLEIKDLHVTFKTEDGLVQAVNGVNLSINRGETLGIVGESGCGKSVSSLAVMGLLPKPHGQVAKGSILFDDVNLLDFNEKEMQKIRGNRISMIFQEPMTSLNPVHRVGKQVAEVLLLHKKCTANNVDQEVVALFERLRIPAPEQRVKEFPHQLSGGMRQRIMIAMALACTPDLLIADEPTTALDVTIQAQIISLMNELKRSFGTAIMFITHDLGVVAETADKVAVMYAGQVIETGRVEDIFTAPLHPYTIGLMASIPQIDKPIPEDKMLQAIPGIVPSLYNLPNGCAFQDRCQNVMDCCRQETPQLGKYTDNHLVRCFLHNKD